MLSRVQVPVLFTHHFRQVDAASGALLGAVSDVQARRIRELVKGAGQPFEYQSFPQMGHAMHEQDPGLYTATLRELTRTLARSTAS